MTQVNYYWICFPCSTDTYLYPDATMTVGTLIKAKDEAFLGPFFMWNFTGSLNMLSLSVGVASEYYLCVIISEQR